MSINQKLNRHKKIIVLVGLAVGVLRINDLLPETIGFFGDNTHWFYTGLMLLAAYVYWKFHMSAPSGASFQRTAPARSISSDPSYMSSVRKQRGEVPRRPVESYQEPRVDPPRTCFGNELHQRFNED